MNRLWTENFITNVQDLLIENGSRWNESQINFNKKIEKALLRKLSQRSFFEENFSLIQMISNQHNFCSLSMIS